MIKAKQAAKTAAATKVTAINKQFEILRHAARLAIDAKAQEDAAKAGKGNATEMLVASLTGSAIWNLKLTFDVTDRNGDIVEHCKGVAISDYAQGFKAEDGKEYRQKTSAFRAAVLLRLFDMKDDKGAQCKTVWTVFGQAFKVAEALRANAVLASLDASGKLKLAGGKGETAKALREAANKSVTSLVNAANGGAAKKGTNATPQNDNKGAIDLDGALRTVAAYASLVKDGKEAPSSARLSYLRKIVADAAKALAEHGDD